MTVPAIRPRAIRFLRPPNSGFHTNVRDFARLDHQWKLVGRRHAGLVYITTATFPQDGRFVGSVVTALDHAARAGALPSEDGVLYLQRP